MGVEAAGGGGGAGGQDCGCGDEQKSQCLGRGQEVLGPFPLAHAQHVDDREDPGDKDGVALAGEREIRARERVINRLGIGGEGKGHHRNIPRPDHRQLRPAEEEAGPRAVSPGEVNVIPAFLRKGGGQLRIAQGAGEGDEPAQQPDGNHPPAAARALRDIGRHLVDAHPDDDAHHQRRRIEQRKLPGRAAGAGRVRVAGHASARRLPFLHRHADARRLQVEKERLQLGVGGNGLQVARVRLGA